MLSRVDSSTASPGRPPAPSCRFRCPSPWRRHCPGTIAPTRPGTWPSCSPPLAHRTGTRESFAQPPHPHAAQPCLDRVPAWLHQDRHVSANSEATTALRNLPNHHEKSLHHAHVTLSRVALDTRLHLPSRHPITPLDLTRYLRLAGRHCRPGSRTAGGEYLGNLPLSTHASRGEYVKQLKIA